MALRKRQVWIILTALLLACVQAVVPVTATEEAAEEECQETEPETTYKPYVPGLHTPHPKLFHPVPAHAQGKVCFCPDTEFPVRRAFHKRGWKTIDLRPRNDSKPVYYDCLGQVQIIWTKYRPASYWETPKWQRHNWLPMQNFMSHKGHFQRALIEQQNKTGRKLPFVPDTYLLPADRERLLERLNQDGGIDEPWVIKLSATDVSSMVVPAETMLWLTSLTDWRHSHLLYHTLHNHRTAWALA